MSESKVRRYAASVAYDESDNGEPFVHMVECDFGKYLLYSDARALEAEVSRLTAELEAARESERKWKALMSCRMRSLGGANVNKPDEPWTYLVMEFWTGHPDPTDQPWIHEHFAKFIAKACAAMKEGA